MKGSIRAIMQWTVQASKGFSVIDYGLGKLAKSNDPPSHDWGNHDHHEGQERC